MTTSKLLEFLYFGANIKLFPITCQKVECVTVESIKYFDSSINTAITPEVNEIYNN